LTILGQIHKKLRLIRACWTNVQVPEFDGVIDLVTSGIRILILIEHLSVVDIFVARRMAETGSLREEAPRPVRTRYGIELPFFLDRFEEEIEGNPHIARPGRELVKLAREFVAAKIRENKLEGPLRELALEQETLTQKLREQRAEVRASQLGWLERHTAAAKEFFGLKERSEALHTENVKLQQQVMLLKEQLRIKKEFRGRLERRHRLRDMDYELADKPWGDDVAMKPGDDSIFRDMSGELKVLVQENMGLRKKLGLDDKNLPAMGSVSALMEDGAIAEGIDVARIEQDMLEAVGEFRRAKWTDREVFKSKVERLFEIDVVAE
jgi:hypothetical protein